MAGTRDISAMLLVNRMARSQCQVSGTARGSEYSLQCTDLANGISIHTVLKTKQISESIGEVVLWRENFPIIRRKKMMPSFRDLPGNFTSRGLSPLYSRKSALFLGQCSCRVIIGAAVHQRDCQIPPIICAVVSQWAIYVV